MELVTQNEQSESPMDKERKRKGIKSLSADEVIDLLDQGIYVFHNGGSRTRTVVGRGIMISYVTGSSRTSINACWMYDFAKWCKGYVKDNKRFIKDDNGGYVELKG